MTCDNRPAKLDMELTRNYAGGHGFWFTGFSEGLHHGTQEQGSVVVGRQRSILHHPQGEASPPWAPTASRLSRSGTRWKRSRPRIPPETPTPSWRLLKRSSTGTAATGSPAPTASTARCFWNRLLSILSIDLSWRLLTAEMSAVRRRHWLPQIDRFRKQTAVSVAYLSLTAGRGERGRRGEGELMSLPETARKVVFHRRGVSPSWRKRIGRSACYHWRLRRQSSFPYPEPSQARFSPGRRSRSSYTSGTFGSICCGSSTAADSHAWRGPIVPLHWKEEKPTFP